MKTDLLMNYFHEFSVIDLLDIGIVILILLAILTFLSKTRGIQIAKGLILLYIFKVMSYALKLNLSKELFEILYTLLFFSLPVIFQQEIRIALEQFGRVRLFKRNSTEDIGTINCICDAVELFSQDKTGALIVIEESTALREYTATGTKLDATISCDLLESIFKNQSALHDGAVILKENRLIAAKCILPLSNTDYDEFNIGTRHRAALGISEQSDCIAVTVSEETGRVSISNKGVLKTMNSVGELKSHLINLLNKNKKA